MYKLDSLSGHLKYRIFENSRHEFVSICTSLQPLRGTEEYSQSLMIPPLFALVIYYFNN